MVIFISQCDYHQHFQSLKSCIQQPNTILGLKFWHSIKFSMIANISAAVKMSRAMWLVHSCKKRRQPYKYHRLCPHLIRSGISLLWRFWVQRWLSSWSCFSASRAWQGDWASEEVALWDATSRATPPRRSPRCSTPTASVVVALAVEGPRTGWPEDARAVSQSWPATMWPRTSAPRLLGSPPMARVSRCPSTSPARLTARATRTQTRGWTLWRRVTSAVPPWCSMVWWVASRGRRIATVDLTPYDYHL